MGGRFDDRFSVDIPAVSDKERVDVNKLNNKENIVI